MQNIQELINTYNQSYSKHTYIDFEMYVMNKIFQNHIYL